MAVEETLKTVLGGLGGVHALAKPDNAALPAIVYRRVSRFIYYSHDGTPLMYRDRYQFNCMGKTYKSMRTLRDGLDTALGANQTNFALCLPEGQDTGIPDDLEGKLRITARDYYIWSRP